MKTYRLDIFNLIKMLKVSIPNSGSFSKACEIKSPFIMLTLPFTFFEVSTRIYNRILIIGF